MYAVNIFTFLRKSFSTKIRAQAFSLRHVQHNSYKTKLSTSLDVKSVGNDVILFHFENPVYFLVINVFSAIQCAFWTYLGAFFMKELKKSSISLEGQRFWEKILEKERKYSDALSIIAMIFGWSILATTLLYSVRSIRKIILHKGGKYITIVTYNLPGFNTLKIPLNDMSSFQHRTRAKKFIPIKIKNKYLYYLVDIRGQFSNPTLFDFTAGMKRTF